MADNTHIEWTDATWNPITGCSIVSPGCTNCYAMALAGTRLKNHPSRRGLTKQVNGKHVWTGAVRFNEQWIYQPLHWAKPRQIFVCAHGDLFAEGVPDAWIDQVFAVMALAPSHTFQVLTKRPGPMKRYLSDPETVERVYDLVMDMVVVDGAKAILTTPRTHDVAPPGNKVMLGLWPLPNVWLGVSVEDQRRADERIPILLDTPAAIRWISAEPLLGELRLSGVSEDRKRTWDWLTGMNGAMYPDGPDFDYGSKLDWVVAGGESGPHARPMHPDWARALRDQCAAADVPFLFKQWGEHTTAKGYPGGTPISHVFDDGFLMVKPGKRRAGRLLDGIEHNAFPEISRATPLQADRPSRDVPRPVRSEAGTAGDSVRTR